MWYNQHFKTGEQHLKYKPYNSNFELSSKWILAKNPNLKKNFLCVYVCVCGGGGGRGAGGGFQPKKKTIGIRLFFVLMLYIKFQVPGSSGSLVLTQRKGVTDR